MKEILENIQTGQFAREFVDRERDRPLGLQGAARSQLGSTRSRRSARGCGR